jgi:hypothetical protein
MPSPHFERVIDRMGLSLATMKRIVTLFDVSLSAAAIRITEGYKGAAVVAWKFKSHPSSIEKLRVHWVASPPGIYIPKFASCPQGSSIFECFETGKETRGFEKLRLGSLRRKYLVESLPTRLWTSKQRSKGNPIGIPLSHAAFAPSHPPNQSRAPNRLLTPLPLCLHPPPRPHLLKRHFHTPPLHHPRQNLLRCRPTVRAGEGGIPLRPRRVVHQHPTDGQRLLSRRIPHPCPRQHP